MNKQYRFVVFDPNNLSNYIGYSYPDHSNYCDAFDAVEGAINTFVRPRIYVTGRPSLIRLLINDPDYADRRTGFVAMLNFLNGVSDE